MASRVVKSILASLYGSAIRLRHMLYDRGLRKIHTFDVPIICVGNVTVGGTGKTPMTELIISHFVKTHSVAVLSRGYGRKTKGYLEVQSSSHYRDVGDEPLQIKLKYPETLVVVCEKRVRAINRIIEEHPEVNLIVMDDGFQHRSVEAKVNIITIDATRPVKDDYLLPLGTLRDVPEAIDRAHYFIINKCPSTMAPIDRRLMRKTLIMYAYQKLYFTRYLNYRAEPLFPDEADGVITRDTKVIAVSGLGNPHPFINSIAINYTLVDQIIYDDHHVYRVRDLRTMREMLNKYPGSVIIITEKDAVKLRVPKKVAPDLRKRLYYIPIEIDFIDLPATDFLKQIEDDIK